MNRAIEATLAVAVMLAALCAAFPAYASDAGAGAPAVSSAAPAAPSGSPAPALTPEEAADGALPPSVEPVGLLGQIWSEGKAGNWWALFGLCLTLAVWVARTMFRNWGKFQDLVLGSRLGSVLFTFFIASLGMLSTTLGAGEPLSWGIAKAAALYGVVAIGGWHGLVKPLVQWIGAKFGG